MGKQELEEILYFKISRELECFKDKMRKLELNEILANAYQVDAMINIYEQLIMLSRMLGKRTLEKMILFPNLLDFLYQKWMQEEDSYNEELQNCIMNAINQLKIMLGNPGRGKTYMAIGLGLKACSMGMSVLFKNAYSLSTKLSEARDNYSLGKLEKRIQKADLLILDEMGYVSFDRYQSELLFKIIAARSERGSIIVTTNLPFSEWTSLFENTAMVAAMIDRLTFQSYVLDMNGESYRLAKTKEARK